MMLKIILINSILLRLALFHHFVARSKFAFEMSDTELPNN